LFTTYFLNLIAGNVFGTKKSPALPSAYYLGLSSTAPNVDGSGVTEPSTNGTGYERIPIDCLTVPNNGKVENSEIVATPESLADWGVMRYYVIFDSQSGGNLLAYQQLSNERTMELNSVMIFKAGEISIGIENETA